MSAAKITWYVAIFMLAAPLTAPAAQETGAAASEAFGVFAKEQSLAESYVVLLNTIGKEDIANYAQGIRLYAVAKAEFACELHGLGVDRAAGEPLDREGEMSAIARRTDVPALTRG